MEEARDPITVEEFDDTHEPISLEEAKTRLAELKAQAECKGLLPWYEMVNEWVGNLEAGNDATAWGWFLTDIRHLHNVHNGYGLECADLHSEANAERFDEISEFSDYVGDFIEDVLGYCYWD